MFCVKCRLKFQVKGNWFYFESFERKVLNIEQSQNTILEFFVQWKSIKRSFRPNWLLTTILRHLWNQFFMKLPFPISLNRNIKIHIVNGASVCMNSMGFKEPINFQWRVQLFVRNVIKISWFGTRIIKICNFSLELDR